MYTIQGTILKIQSQQKSETWEQFKRFVQMIFNVSDFTKEYDFEINATLE